MLLISHIREDINSVLERDPAARSRLEVLLCYPGLWAVWIHRVSHALWSAKLRLLARLLSQVARFFTCVDIHPGAQLGRRLFIDHAMGVVIGEMLAAQAGVGHMMAQASATFQTDKVFVGLVLLTGFGFVLTEIIKQIEKRFDSWRI